MGCVDKKRVSPPAKDSIGLDVACAIDIGRAQQIKLVIQGGQGVAGQAADAGHDFILQDVKAEIPPFQCTRLFA